MKKLLAIFLSISIIISGTNFKSYAIVENISADQLNQLGILKGSNGDLMLTKSITRAEAAALMVRLLGKEKEMIANGAAYMSNTFPDVANNAWYYLYVAYCKEMGIINGTSEGTFKPNNSVSEQEFLNMLLKTMGYSSSHFNWNSVFSTAYEKGYVTNPIYAQNKSVIGNYTRAGVADSVYNALDQFYAGKTIRPIDYLVSNGSVDAAIAIKLGFIEADKLVTKIASLNVVNSKALKVTLNESVKEILKENVTVLNGATTVAIDTLKIENDILTIALKTPLTAGDSTITLKEVVDQSNNIVKDVKYGFAGYIPAEVKSSYFKISKVEAVGNSLVYVHFTHPVNLSAEFPLYYDIYQGTQIFEEGRSRNLAVASYPVKENVVAIYSKEKTFSAGAVYTVKINGAVTSEYGTKLNNGNGDSMSFVAVNTPNPTFGISNIQVVDNKFIDLEFTSPVDSASILNNLNYSLVNKTTNVPVGPALDAQINKDFVTGNRMVRLKFVNIDAGQEYELTVNNVYDYLKATKIDNEKLPFSGRASMTQGFKLDVAVPVDQTKVVLYFNKGIDPITSLTTPIIFGGGQAIVSRVYDPEIQNQLILFLDDSTPLSPTSMNTVTVLPGFKDFVGQVSGTNMVYEMQPSSVVPAAPTAYEALRISRDQILVSFSGEVDQTSSTVPAKYVLEYKSGTTTATKTAIGVGSLVNNKVVVTFDGLSESTVYNLRIGGINDYPNQLVSPTVNLSLVSY